MIAIKLSPTLRGYSNRATVRMGTINLYSTTSTIRYNLVKIPDEGYLIGGNWANVNLNSGVQYKANATSYSGGEEIDNGFISASAGAGQSGKSLSGTLTPNTPSAAKKNFITQNFYGTNSEVFVVAVTNISADATSVAAGVQWREIY